MANSSLFTPPSASTSVFPTNSSSVAGTLTEPSTREEYPRSSLRTTLILSAVLIPVVALPYALMRRHYVALRSDFVALRTANASLSREIRKLTESTKDQEKMTLNISSTLKENARVLQLNHQLLDQHAKDLALIKKLSGESRASLHLGPNVLAKLQDIGSMLSEMQRASREQDSRMQRWQNENISNEQWRAIYSQAMRETGGSLANIAKFMHEVEVREGWSPLSNDGRGIDKIRHAAKHLDDAGQCLSTNYVHDK